MRLIDADKLKKELKVNGLGYQYYMLDNAPTVKSIPIEWVNKYIDSTLDEGNSQMLGFKAAIIKEMIEEWEKENEANAEC